MKKNTPHHPAERALDALYARPEFLIRRAHQVASAVFTEACAALDLTPSQYATLYALRECSSVGQNELGRLISLDRSTTSLVVRLLRERGLVQASADATDRRKSLLSLTGAGRQMLNRAEKMSARCSAQLLSVFNQKQAASFLDLLNRFAASRGPAAPVAGD
ncbi:MAG: winged helix-turn-helix transcriptional regulator [Rhizobacter sp.]|nr:winged helix-turn-helix transcriptional regulator [Rhizobacter sp.]